MLYIQGRRHNYQETIFQATYETICTKVLNEGVAPKAKTHRVMLFQGQTANLRPTAAEAAAATWGSEITLLH